MNGMKNDRLDALIMMSAHVLAEKNSDELLRTDTSDVTRPKYLDRKIKRMIRRERRKREYGSWYPALKNAAAGILIACAVTLAMVMSVEAVRTALWETITKWFDDYISISHVTEDEVLTSIETKMQPTVYPEEWEVTAGGDNVSLFTIKYRSGGKLMVSYHQWLLNQDVMRVDSKNAVVSEIQIGNFEGTLITYTDDAGKILTWCDGKYSFALVARVDSITTELLVEMAQSVK